MTWKDELRSCTLCPHLSRNVVVGEGPKNPKLVLIGEAPGAEEDRLLRPFVGGSGRVLDYALQHAGIRRDEVYITNMLRCRPPKNRPPTPTELHNCQRWLLLELADIAPFHGIVTLGSTPYSYFLRRESDILTYRGSPCFTEVVHHEDGSPIKLLPTIHPAFVMRQWMYADVLKSDLIKAQRYFEDPVYTPPKKDYLLPEDPGAEEYIRDLMTKPYAADIETTGLYPQSCDILGIGFSHTPGTGIFFPLPAYQEEIRPILKADVPKIFQNGTFDLYFLRYNGYDIPRYEFDTKFAQNILCPSMPASLAFLNSLYTMYPYYKTWKGKEIRKHVNAVPQRILQEYCIRDADATLQCYYALNQELQDEGMETLMSKHIMPLANALIHMRLKGLRIDVPRIQRMKDELAPRIRQITALFEALGCNPGSPKQLGELLLRNGVTGLPKTPTGQLQTDEDALTAAMKRTPHDLIKLLLEYRKINKIYTTYLQGIEERRQHDRLHTELVIGGTETGRLSSRDPNLQNIPENMRAVFIAEEGDILLEADYSQVELRIAAALAEDETLLEDLQSGMDVPTKIGLAMGYTPERCKADRLKLKTVLYGSIYGRTARSIAMEFGITTREAQTIIDFVVTRYPKLVQRLTLQQTYAREHRYLRTPFGRKLYMTTPGYNPQAYNYPIQSSAADVMMGSIILLHQAFPDMLRHTVHDSVLLSIPQERLHEIAPQVESILTRPIPELHFHRFPVKMKTGISWGEMTPWTSSAS